jgi:uncharacterized cupin superfamily protein
MSTVIDPRAVPEENATGYPAPFRASVVGRFRRRLARYGGLTNFGVNLVRLEPGARSALRHWHAKQDEFVYVLEGTPTLLSNAGSTRLEPGMSVAFPAGVEDGHCLLNDTDQPVKYLEVGDRTPGDTADYPDVDLAVRDVDGRWVYTHKDGTAYPEK